MIPKIIHYCWFGGNPLPSAAEKCIESWRRLLPDYEIREWNEQNFDVTSHPYAKMAYEQKRWAYLSDIVRLIVLEREGGFYFDTDVELVRRPDELLQDEQVSAWFGWENSKILNTGLGFAAEAHHPAVKAMLAMYDGLLEIKGCPQQNTEALLPFGLVCDGSRQHVCEAEILPTEFLCPYNDLTGVLRKTKNTISIHWFSKSPHGKMAFYKSKLSRIYHRIQEMLGMAHYS